MERLDRAYASASWPTLFPNLIVYHESILCSDHAAIVYTTFDQNHASKRPYEIEAWCLQLHSVVVIIKEVCSLHFHGLLMFYNKNLVYSNKN